MSVVPTFASLKLVFCPERPNAAQGGRWACTGQQCKSLRLLTLEAPATKWRIEYAALGLPGTTAKRKFLTLPVFLKGLRLENQGVLFWLRKEQPHHPQVALFSFAL